MEAEYYIFAFYPQTLLFITDFTNCIQGMLHLVLTDFWQLFNPQPDPPGD